MTSQPKVAILREEGSNGDREMSVAFDIAGFQTFDVTMTDLLAGRAHLDFFQGLALVGGFSFADVLGAGRGWAQVILSHDRLKQQFERFRHRTETFSLGVCNGAQLMTELGWVFGQLVKNQSGRFESRLSTVSIPTNTKSIMLKDFGGSRLPVWIAHGEGQWKLGSYRSISQQTDQVALVYVDSLGKPTTHYPENPNGSDEGLAGVCSENGRHLAMMPHPERTIKLWQVPYGADQLDQKIGEFPWQEMFRNAYRWSTTH